MTTGRAILRRTVAPLTLAASLALALAPVRAHAAGTNAEPPPSNEAHEPAIFPSAAWFATQFLPSPEVVAGSTGTHFGMRWQVTPLLYSWGINRRLSPWRNLVVEPNVRNSGSIELFVSPELYFLATPRMAFRPGIRSYFPILDHGEGLSASLGVSYQGIQGRSSACYEVGAYMLYGVFGVQLSYAPAPNQPVQTIVTFRVRYF